MYSHVASFTAISYLRNTYSMHATSPQTHNRYLRVGSHTSAMAFLTLTGGLNFELLATAVELSRIHLDLDDSREQRFINVRLNKFTPRTCNGLLLNFRFRFNEWLPLCYIDIVYIASWNTGQSEECMNKTIIVNNYYGYQVYLQQVPSKKVENCDISWYFIYQCGNRMYW